MRKIGFFRFEKSITVLAVKRNFIIGVKKRGMLNSVRNLLYRGNINRTIAYSGNNWDTNQALHGKRDFATWNACLRTQPPLKAKAPEMETDPETGFEIMNAIDYSGKNHFLLYDADFKSDTYLKVYGSFTTKNTSFKKKAPIEVSNFTIEGENKSQFLHIYNVPKLLKKKDALRDDIATYGISHVEYQDVFKKIPTD